MAGFRVDSELVLVMISGVVAGRIAEHGSCEQLRRAGPGNAFAELMDAYVPEDDKESADGDTDGDADGDTDGDSVGSSLALGDSGEGSPRHAGVASHVSGGRRRTASSEHMAQAENTPAMGAPAGDDAAAARALAAKASAGALIAEESKATGHVGLPVYRAYFIDSVADRLRFKHFNIFSLLFLSVFGQCCTLVFEWWLSRWSDEWAKVTPHATPSTARNLRSKI